MKKTGLFETMRAYNQKIVYLDEHLKRMRRSSKILKIKMPSASIGLKRLIKEEVGASGERDAYVKVILSASGQGADISLIVKKYKPLPAQKYRKGFRAGVSRLRQDEHSLLARLKTTHRFLYENSFRAAKKRGLDEALILNAHGYLTEASRSNIFFVKDRKIFTPALACGCLEGITRRAIFDLARKQDFKVYTGNFTLADLYTADEAFLTNSLIGIMPLTMLGGRSIGRNKCRPITEAFIRKYNSLLK